MYFTGSGFFRSIILSPKLNSTLTFLPRQSDRMFLELSEAFFDLVSIIQLHQNRAGRYETTAFHIESDCISQRVKQISLQIESNEGVRLRDQLIQRWSI